MGQGNYEFRDKNVVRDHAKDLHPVWRGVGCLLLILIAAGGYWFGGWFLQANAENTWIYIPPVLFNPPYFPAWLPSGLIVRVALGILFAVFGYGLLSLFYAVLFPLQPGENDAPLPKKRRNKSRWRSKGR